MLTKDQNKIIKQQFQLVLQTLVTETTMFSLTKGKYTVNQGLIEKQAAELRDYLDSLTVKE